MQGVDVVAQPHAGIGDGHAGRRGVLGQPRGEEAGVARLDALLEPEEARRLGLQAPVDPARHEPVIVVAGQHEDLPAGSERAAGVGEERGGQRAHVALRRLAQLDRVAEHDEPVDALQRVEQRGAQLRAAQDVGLRRRPEVQVGDHQRPHGPPG